MQASSSNKHHLQTKELRSPASLAAMSPTARNMAGLKTVRKDLGFAIRGPGVSTDHYTY